MKVKNVDDVAAWRLCVGCGACAYICPSQNIELVNLVSEGIRPLISDPQQCGSCRQCLDVCPGVEVHYGPPADQAGILDELRSAYGPVIEIWEGHAGDPEIRHKGSSGGALTALALFCLEKEQWEGVLHIGQDPSNPLLNRTFFSKSRGELLKRTGSRYAPASACDGLKEIELAQGPCVFIGQPSEIAALRKAERLRPELSTKVGLALSFFCAGSPASQGTIDLIKKHGIDPGEVTEIRYRGRGWPGNFSVWVKGTNNPVLEMTYRDSWRFVQGYRPWGVHLWPDGSGELADISCGDPWYRPIQAGEAGSSLIVIRTQRGAAILKAAAEAGYLVLKAATSGQVVESQKNLVEKKGAVWGRVTTMRMLGLPVPEHRNSGSFGIWLSLPLAEKLRSILGTARRIFARKYFRRGPKKALPAKEKFPKVLKEEVLH